ncbi:MAG TPA: 2Fe-2S iron-sulfur cluster-binding protein [Spirochaetota bacterium]|nr:2Fe-2S iron-sulfur cluster-binding protein [Spirochaetota bacterium]
MSQFKFTIDGQECTAAPGQTILQAARDNDIFIPVLCNMKELIPAGACRVCTVKVAGKYMTACTTPAREGMVVENMTDAINDKRKSIIEMLFAEGNHFCPACEKSGNCELQALGYYFNMMVPRFPYLFPSKEIEAFSNILIDHNRCIQCKRCVYAIKTKDDKNIFQMKNRGGKRKVTVAKKLEAKLTPELAAKAMENCPVGAILKKEVGWVDPIGTRKYDKKPIDQIKV